MAAAVPVVRVIGPGRNIGKTWLASSLIAALTEGGYAVGAIKRSHHPVPADREGADTDRFAKAGAETVIYGASDATLVRTAVADDAASLVRILGASVDVVVIEGFKGDTLGAVALIEPGERALVHLRTMDGLPIASHPVEAVEAIAADLICALRLSAEGDATTRQAIRDAALHHGHRCPGLTLGARMTMHALDVLGVASDHHALRAMEIEVESARCATDAIVAATGCTLGSSRLVLRERGKVAATFSLGGQAVRLAVRSGLDAQLDKICSDRRHAQDRLYRTLGAQQLFSTTFVDGSSSRRSVVGPRGRRTSCAECGEEVAEGWTFPGAGGATCLDCGGAANDAPGGMVGTMRTPTIGLPVNVG